MSGPGKTLAELAAKAREERKNRPMPESGCDPDATPLFPGTDELSLLYARGAELGMSQDKVDVMLRDAGTLMRNDDAGPVLYNADGFTWERYNSVLGRLGEGPSRESAQKAPCWSIDEDAFGAWYAEQPPDVQELLPVRLEERIVVVVDDWEPILAMAAEGHEIGGVTPKEAS